MKGLDKIVLLGLCVVTGTGLLATEKNELSKTMPKVEKNNYFQIGFNKNNLDKNEISFSLANAKYYGSLFYGAKEDSYPEEGSYTNSIGLEAGRRFIVNDYLDLETGGRIDGNKKIDDTSLDISGSFLIGGKIYMNIFYNVPGSPVREYLSGFYAGFDIGGSIVDNIDVEFAGDLNAGFSYKF
jgi:hypothetical protein